MQSWYSAARLRLVLAVVALMVAAVPASAQFKTKKVEAPEVGLELKMFRALAQKGLPEDELQIKIAWAGTEILKDGREKTPVKLELGWFEIDRTAPRVDSGPRIAVKNGGNTLPSFLYRRELDDPDDSRLRKVLYDKKNKAPKFGRKQFWQAVELERNLKLRLRVWFVETEQEIFGLYASCETRDQGLRPFVEFIETKMLKTVKRSEPIEVEAKDPYEDSKLPYIEARRAKIEDLPGSWRHIDTPNFLLLTPISAKGKAGDLVDAIAADLEIMRKVYEERFPPEKPLDQLATVRVFGSNDAYQDYVQIKGSGGVWVPSKKELLLPNPAEKVRSPLAYRKGVNPFETLYHEAMHQYFSYRSDAPSPLSWFDEGYGEHFGGAKLNRKTGKLKEIGVNETRWKMVKLQVKNDAAPSVSKLVRMTQKEFYGRFAGSNYAFAWAFCHFLEKERDKRAGGNKQYAAIPDLYLENISRLAGDPSVSSLAQLHQDAVDATFKDIDMDQLQKDWLAEMKKWADAE